MHAIITVPDYNGTNLTPLASIVICQITQLKDSLNQPSISLRRTTELKDEQKILQVERESYPESQSSAALIAENQIIRDQLQTSQQQAQQLQQEFNILSKMLMSLLSVLHKIGFYPSWQYNNARATQYVIINSFWSPQTTSASSFGRFTAYSAYV
jgi:hypothetical protein